LSRLTRHAALGARWLACGARLLRFNPWLLGGMGACAALLLAALWAIPLLGGPLIALLAPVFLASFLLAIERIDKLNMPLPPVLRRAALRESPRQLFAVLRHERRVLPIAAVSLACMASVLLTNMLVWLIAGAAWVRPWLALDARGLLAIAAALLLALVLYFLLAAAIVYALPRTFLRDKPLVPEVVRSFKAGVHYAMALATVLAPLVLVLPVSLALAPLSGAAAYAAAIVLYAPVLPLVACALYCSYRHVYRPRPPVAAHA
jgi:hypothetical protein